MDDQNQCLGRCDSWFKSKTWASSHIDGVLALTSSISSAAFFLELVLLIPRQPAIVLQYKLMFQIGQCIGYRFLHQLWDLWVTGNERIPHIMSPPNQLKSGILQNCFFHKPVRNDCRLCFDRDSHEDSKTMRAGGLAALEGELSFFCL